MKEKIVIACTVLADVESEHFEDVVADGNLPLGVLRLEVGEGVETGVPLSPHPQHPTEEVDILVDEPGGLLGPETGAAGQHDRRSELVRGRGVEPSTSPSVGITIGDSAAFGNRTFNVGSRPRTPSAIASRIVARRFPNSVFTVDGARSNWLTNACTSDRWIVAIERVPKYAFTCSNVFSYETAVL